MKVILFFLVFSFELVNCYSQNCNIGNEDTTGFNSTSGYIFKNNLLGVKFNLNVPGVLTSLNLLAKDTGAGVQMAVYIDNGGVPGNLIVVSNTTTVVSGIVSLSVNPTQLIAGAYWIMAVYDADGNHTYRASSVSNIVYYSALTFGSAIPTNGSGFLNYTGKDFTYFMEISCGFVGLTDVKYETLVYVTPNPSSDFLYFCNVDNHPILEIVDISGRVVDNLKRNDIEGKIDIRNLEDGIYFLKIQDQKSIKFIKN